MTEKYFQDIENKKRRSDNCNKDCKYKDEKTKRCSYETCLLEEIPPTQQGSISVSCWICGKTISISTIAFDGNRMCSECKEKLAELIGKKNAIISHIEGKRYD